MRVCEWLLGVENDVYHKVLYFLLYLDCEKVYEVVELYYIVDVDLYIYITIDVEVCWKYDEDSYLNCELLIVWT